MSSFYKVKKSGLHRNKKIVQGQATRIVTQLKFKCSQFYLVSKLLINSQYYVRNKTSYKVSVIQTSNWQRQHEKFL